MKSKAMGEKLRILFVEDSISDAELIWREIKRNNIEIEQRLVDTRGEYIDGLKTYSPDVIICDYSLPRFDGMSALRLRSEMAPYTPFILVTGPMKEEIAVECIKGGADDYVLKDNLSRLVPAIRSSINKYKLMKHNDNAVQALMESEAKFRNIFENVADIYYEALLDGTIMEVSPSIELVSGGQYSQADLIGKKLFDFFKNPGNQDTLLSFLHERGSASDFEITLINRDRSAIPCSISAKLTSYGDGSSLRIIGSIRDITARKKVEEALQKSLNFSESLLKTIPFGMDIVDETGKVLFQSENLKRIFGEATPGMKCWDIYRDDKKQCPDCPLVQGINVGETEVYEAHGVLGNKIFDISHTGMIYEGKKAILEIFQDITEKKYTENELIKVTEKAMESDRLKTAFLHNISHEIRTPMNAIVGISSLLNNSNTDFETQKSYIEIITQSSYHLLSIITDIVDISNIEADIVKIAKKGINLNSILKTVQLQVHPIAKNKDLTLVFKPGLSDSEALIITDGIKVTQILINLVNNALKFTEKGNVELKYELKENFLEFSVSDTGIGIPADYHDKVFDRFYRVQNSGSKLYDGTGLGLAISKAYVELLGGKIWLSSEQNRGSTFKFTIPYEKQKIYQSPDSNSLSYEGFSFPREKTILIAEDIDSNYKLIDFYLAKTNTKLVRASNGIEAVEYAISGRNIDLIIMDLRMPLMDGYEAVKLIREAKVTIPIIAQTAYQDSTEKLMNIGCNGVLYKPIEKNDLLKVLSSFI